MTSDLETIIKKAQKLYKRAGLAAKTNQILICVYDEHFDKLNKWTNQKKHRKEFLSDYQLYLLRVLAIELSVILDKSNSSKNQYSIEALLSQSNKYLYEDGSPDGQLFNLQDQIEKATEFNGFVHIKAQNLPKIIDDKAILKLLQEEKKEFREKHKDDIIMLKKQRDTFLVHPDDDGNADIPSANFFMEMSEWCLAYCNLFMGTLVASGFGLYTADGLKTYNDRIQADYGQFLKEMMK